jgi:hypothetical protein
MKILKVKDTTVYLYDLVQFFLNKGVNEGDRFGVSWKIGKKHKLKSYTVVTWDSWKCDDCGNISEVELKKGDKTVKMDNHFGPSSYGMSSFI